MGLSNPTFKSRGVTQTGTKEPCNDTKSTYRRLVQTMTLNDFHPSPPLTILMCLNLMTLCTQATKDKNKFCPLKLWIAATNDMWIKTLPQAGGNAYFCRRHRRRHRRIRHPCGGLWCAPRSPAPRTAPCRSGHTPHRLRHGGRRIRRNRTCWNGAGIGVNTDILSSLLHSPRADL